VLSSKQEVIDDIKSHIQRHGGKYSAWYVSIGRSAGVNLLSQRGAKGALFIYRQAYSSYVAVEVCNYFVHTLGTKGGNDREDELADTVYAYRREIDASIGRSS
jgi:hypothetical protein